MKIAIVRTDKSSQDPASYNSQEMGMAKAFVKLGHTVDVFMASETGHINCRTVRSAGDAIRVIELPYKNVPLLNEPLYVGFKKFLRQEQYDYVQINEEGNLASWFVALTCHRTGCRFGIYQGIYRAWSGRKWAFYELLHKRLLRPFLLRNVVGAFCKTSQAKQFLEDRGYHKTEIVPVGLDVEKFQHRIDRNWRDELGIPANEQLILYVGRLEQDRNPEFIAKLASQAEKGKHFVLIGEGPCRVFFEKLKASGELKNLLLVGRLRQEELPAIYEQSDVLILPSSSEIFGMVVVESLFFGTPVVCRNTAGPAEIIQSELHGRLINDLDSDKWLNAISSYGLASLNPEARVERSAYVRARFDWLEIGRSYLECVKRFL